MSERTYQLHHTITAHSSDVNWVSFSDSVLATSSGDKTVRLWKLSDYSEVEFSPLCGHSYYVYCCELSPFGTLLASCSMDGKLILWNAKNGEKKWTFSHSSQLSIRICKFSPKSDMLVSGSDDHSLCLWDIVTGNLIRSLVGHEGSVVTCAFSPDGCYIVSGSTCGDVCVWDAVYGQGRCLTTIPDAHDLGVTSCAFSTRFAHSTSDDSLLPGAICHYMLVSGGQDNLVKLWEIEAEIGSSKVKLTLRNTLIGHEGPVQAVAFNSDAQRIASTSVDKTVKIWNAKNAKLIQTISSHTRYVTCCAFSRDDQFLASGSNDRTVILWKLQDSPQSEAVANDQTVDQLTGQLSHSLHKPFSDWTVDEVGEWLEEIGLAEYREVFVSNKIDGAELVHLTNETLMDQIGMEALGHRTKLLRIVSQSQHNPRNNTAVQGNSVPDEFLCPITKEVMRDPVMAADGYTYERQAISAWINKGIHHSPMTNATLDNLTLVPNRNLKMLIQHLDV